MTFEELIDLTTIRNCPKCNLQHAVVRTCDETIEADRIQSTRKENA